MNYAKKRSDCPISVSLEIWGDRWTLLIIRDLMFEGRETYGDFLNAGEGIATNILADRLKKLTKCGIVEQIPNKKSKSASIYVLTEKGIDMMPMFLEVYLWSEKHLELPEMLCRRIDTMKQDRIGFAKKLRAKLVKRRNGNG